MPAGKRPKKNASPDQTLTIREAAMAFDVSIRTLQRFRADGRLPGVRQGRCILVRRGDVERALAWKDPTFLLRVLLNTDDGVPLGHWMDGWKQLTRMSTPDEAASRAWIAWAEAATRNHPEFRVIDYRVEHLIRAADNGVRHEHVDRMVHSMRQFEAAMVARDALRNFFNSVTPWTGA